MYLYHSFEQKLHNFKNENSSNSRRLNRKIKKELSRYLRVDHIIRPCKWIAFLIFFFLTTQSMSFYTFLRGIEKRNLIFVNFFLLLKVNFIILDLKYVDTTEANPKYDIEARKKNCIFFAVWKSNHNHHQQMH